VTLSVTTRDSGCGGSTKMQIPWRRSKPVCHSNQSRITIVGELHRSKVDMSIVDYQFKEFLGDFDDRSAWDGKVVISFNRFTRRMGAMALLFTTVVTVVCNS